MNTAIPPPIATTLAGRAVLIVEDEYLLALDLRDALENAGATVLEPVATIEDALDLVDAVPELDAAVLDISLRHKFVFPVADLLAARSVPFVFCTAYDRDILPDRFRQIGWFQKPLNTEFVVEQIAKLIAS